MTAEQLLIPQHQNCLTPMETSRGSFKSSKKERIAFVGCPRLLTSARGDCETGHEQHPEGT